MESSEDHSDSSHPVTERLNSNSELSENFDVIMRLGSGSFGSVLKVKHKVDSKVYAMKIVEFTEVADREVKALAELSHPNVVQYSLCLLASDNDCDSFKPVPNLSSELNDSDEKMSETRESGVSFSENPLKLYIFMEFCGGGTLAEWIEKRNMGQQPRTKEEINSVFHEIVSGLQYIHSQGFIHRDLKPANILFADDGRVKIGDFGLATPMADENGGPLQRTQSIGTPSYRSPEQVNQTHYDEKTDMFPLGLIWFELLWKMSTAMERGVLWEDVRNQRFPQRFLMQYKAEHKYIMKLLSVDPNQRLDASEILKVVQLFFYSDKSISRKQNSA